MLYLLQKVLTTCRRLALPQEKDTLSRRASDDNATTLVDPVTSVLRQSGLFDEVYYSKRYGVEAGLALDHYIHSGDKLFYKPNPTFDTAFYRDADEGLDRENMNTLLHYIKYGHQEGRKVNEYVEHTMSEMHWIRGVRFI